MSSELTGPSNKVGPKEDVPKEDVPKEVGPKEVAPKEDVPKIIAAGVKYRPCKIMQVFKPDDLRAFGVAPTALQAFRQPFKGDAPNPLDKEAAAAASRGEKKERKPSDKNPSEKKPKKLSAIPAAPKKETKLKFVEPRQVKLTANYHPKHRTITPELQTYIETELTEPFQEYPAKVQEIESTNPYLTDTEVFIPQSRKGFYRFIQDNYAEQFKLEPQLMGALDRDACAKLEKAGEGAVEAFLYQKFIREYIRVASPYRGVLVYHGLGSGKTCSAIAAAEAIYGSSNKKIIVMTPFSLRANFMSEISFCGFRHFNLNNHWVSTPLGPKGDISHTYAKSVLSLKDKYLQKVLERPEEERRVIWVADFSQSSNYNDLEQQEREDVREQLSAMIDSRITFINYNGVSAKVLKDYACGRDPVTREPVEERMFDNAIVVIDEVHNLTRLMQGEVLPYIIERAGRKRRIPVEPIVPGKWVPGQCDKPDPRDNYKRAFLFYKLLTDARNSKIIGLSGTPIINFPDELGVLANILAGYIECVEVSIASTDKAVLKRCTEIIEEDSRVDMVRFRATTQKNIILISVFNEGYERVTDAATDEFVGVRYNEDAQDGIRVVFERIKLKLQEANIQLGSHQFVSYPRLPIDTEEFMNTFINKNVKADSEESSIKNRLILQKRLTGLISYYAGSKKEFMPRVTKDVEVKCPMSDYVLGSYSTERKREIEGEQGKDKEKGDAFAAVEMFAKMKNPSSYRFRSRAICNFAFPMTITRPFPSSVREEEMEVGEVDNLEISEAERDNVADVEAADAVAEEEAAIAPADVPEQSIAQVVNDEQKQEGGMFDGGDEDEEGDEEDEEDEDEEDDEEDEDEEDEDEEDEDEDEDESNQVGGVNTPPGSPTAAIANVPVVPEVSAIAAPINVAPNAVPIAAPIAAPIIAPVKKGRVRGPASGVKIKPIEVVPEVVPEVAPEVAPEVVPEVASAVASAIRKPRVRGPASGVKIKPLAEEPVAEPVAALAPRAKSYQQSIADAMNKLNAERNNWLKLESLSADTRLENYSTKLDYMLRRINTSNGSNLVYSQFKTVEGLGVLGIALKANGFAEIKIEGSDQYPSFSKETIESLEKGAAQKRYILFTGEGSKDRRNLILNIFNGNFDKLPENMRAVLEKGGFDERRNRYGEICWVIGITGAGAEGISLKCCRSVHIMEPYWNNVRLEQVKGRAIRICSHKDLPYEDRTVDIYTYYSTFSEEQMKEPNKIDVSIISTDKYVTSDENVFNVSKKKDAINEELIRVMKESAVDCGLNAADNLTENIQCLAIEGRPDQYLFEPDLQQDLIQMGRFKEVVEQKQEKIEENRGGIAELMKLNPKAAALAEAAQAAQAASVAKLPVKSKSAKGARGATDSFVIIAHQGQEYIIAPIPGKGRMEFYMYDKKDSEFRTPLGEVKINPATGKLSGAKLY